ncbi:MAG: thiamine biosynthesis lipoprotein [Planctomycetota bacterium]|jgi:thiamine biosynthesis lipoprotein
MKCTSLPSLRLELFASWSAIGLGLVLGLASPVPNPAHALQAQAESEDLILAERELGVMGTDLVIKVLGGNRDELAKVIDAAVQELVRVEDLMTDWRASPLTELNDAAGTGAHVVPKELAVLIQRGLDIGKLTSGAFDITYAGAGKLWDFKADPPLIPDDAAIAEALKKVDYRRVVVDLAASTVDLPAGMRIGLGGIAKGYGVDRAMELLLKHDVKHALVSAGGDLKALGREFGKLWEIAIRHPREAANILAMIPLSNTCVMTSGDYERFFERGGRRFHHILDPRTGFPSTGCMSATVTGPDAAFCDAIATAMCVLGAGEGLKLIEAIPRVEALLVDMQGQTHVSSGLK